MSNTLSEAIRFTKDEVISHEERLFIENFKDIGEIGPPLITRLPKWLWGGSISSKKHPYIKIKFIHPMNEQLKNAISQQQNQSISSSATASSSPSSNPSVLMGSSLVTSQSAGVDGNGFIVSNNHSPLPLSSTFTSHVAQEHLARSSVSRGTLVHTHSSHSVTSLSPLRLSLASGGETQGITQTRSQSTILSNLATQCLSTSESPSEESRSSHSGSRLNHGDGQIGTDADDEEEQESQEEIMPVRLSRTIMALDLEMGKQNL